MKSLREQLHRWLAINGPSILSQQKPAPTKKKSRTETLTQRDLQELMGTKRPIYRRKHGGAFQQR